MMGHYKGKPGTPYRPGSGTEGADFQENFCLQCKHDAKYQETMDGEDSCPLARRMFMCDPDDDGVGDGDGQYPKELTHDADGVPVCTAFIDLETVTNEEAMAAVGELPGTPLFEVKP